MSSLGSDNWLGASDYEEGGELHTRAIAFVANVQWDALVAIATGLRNGVSCELSSKFSLGHFNLVRRITFADGVSWIARIRLPELKGFFGEREALDAGRSMEIEVSTMKYLKEHTTIPLPEVFSYDFDPKNEVEAPYIFMSYIHGNVASELRMDRGCAMDKFGTPSQDEKFRRQMADIQAQLARLSFDRIGSIYQADNGTYEIGPEIETGQGPWGTAENYWTAWSDHVAQVARTDAKQEVQQDPSFDIPALFKELIGLYSQPSQTRFGLVNRDFGAHNVLVDDTFNIIGVIDFDGVMTAPIERVAQVPCDMNLDPPPPGHVDTRPAAIERIERSLPLIAQYVEMMKMAVKETTDGESESAAISGSNVADALLSDGARIVQGLIRFCSHQTFVNQPWLVAYEEYLRREQS
ncbi:hypothetical protein LTR86_008261 [Recurvomyces mirabilis]|nr:hypothetical protein LTR86_008261 [Recurvomyces mirabilis]